MHEFSRALQLFRNAYSYHTHTEFDKKYYNELWKICVENASFYLQLPELRSFHDNITDVSPEDFKLRVEAALCPMRPMIYWKNCDAICRRIIKVDDEEFVVHLYYNHNVHYLVFKVFMIDLNFQLGFSKKSM